MGVLIGHGQGTDPEKLRQLVLNLGLECYPEDCIPLGQVEVRLPQVMADLVLIAFGTEKDAAVQAISTASKITASPILALGPADDSNLLMRAMRSGAREYLDASDASAELEAALEKLAVTDEDARIRGSVFAIYSPNSGSGTTTVACNLAASLGRQHPGEVSIMELSRVDGDMALFFDIEPTYTVEHACQRWDRLDSRSLDSGLVKHDTGVSVLAHEPEEVSADIMEPHRIRRIAVLLRSMFAYTVIDCDSVLAPEQFEALKIADVIGFVLRPDVPAVRKAQRALDDMVAAGVDIDRVRLLVNRWGQAGQLPLKTISDILDLEPFQLIPDDPRRVNNAINQGLLLTQIARGAPITRRFGQMATQLDGQA